MGSLNGRDIKTSISVGGPFSWSNTLAFLNRSMLHPIYRIENDRLHRLAVSGPFLWHLILGPAERPGAKTPEGEEPGAEIPQGEDPGAEIPRGEDPGAEAASRAPERGGRGSSGPGFTLTVTGRIVGRLRDGTPEGEQTGKAKTAGEAAMAQEPEGAVRDMARHIVSARDDGEAMARTLSRDPELGKLLAQRPGVRIVRMAGLYEALADAIIGQQISVAAAHTVRRRLMEALAPAGPRAAGSFPGRVEGGATPGTAGGELPGGMLPFPSAEAAAEAPKRLLDACGLGRRGDYLRGVARLAADGALPREQDLKAMALPEAEAALTAIRGVGPWTARSALLFGVGRNDVLPAADLGLREGMRLLYRLDRRPEAAEAAAAARKWRGWESYAAYYFWGARMLLDERGGAAPGTGE